MEMPLSRMLATHQTRSGFRFPSILPGPLCHIDFWIAAIPDYTTALGPGDGGFGVQRHTPLPFAAIGPCCCEAFGKQLIDFHLRLQSFA